MDLSTLDFDDWGTEVAQTAVAFLRERLPYEPLADFLFNRVNSEWLRVRGLFIRRMRAGDQREALPNPEDLIQALNRLHMMSAAAMWAYLKVQDPSNVYGSPEAMEFFKELIREESKH